MIRKSEARFKTKSDAKIKYMSEMKIKNKSKMSKSVNSIFSEKLSPYIRHYGSDNSSEERLSKYMSEMTLLLPEETAYCPELNPPPSTPTGEFDFGFTFHTLPKTFRDVTNLQVPIVRKMGVKSCIAILGAYFDCTDYEFNFLHFWFLDVLTDCIWCAQDQYEFPEDQQKIVLSWILFFLDVIRDTNHVLTQKSFFALFKESILAAAEVLEEGSGEILLPLKLIKVKNDSERSSKSSLSSERAPNSNNGLSTGSKSSCKSRSEPTNSMDYESVLEFQIGQDYHQFLLDHEICYCQDYNDNTSSSTDIEVEEQTIQCDLSMTQNEFPELSSFLMEDEDEEETEQVDDFINDDWTYKDFYKPDETTPSRFLSSNTMDKMDAIQKKEITTTLSLRDLGDPSKLAFLQINPSKPASLDGIKDYIIFRKESVQPFQVSVCDENPVNFSENIVETEKMKEEKIVQELRYFKTMEQRARELNDSSIGLSDWQVDEGNEESSKKTIISGEESSSRNRCFNSERIEILMKAKDLKTLSIKELLSYGVLWAIIDFVYEYFGDSFQYSLIRTALTIIPNTFQQRMNETWQKPKGLKEDLTIHVKDLKQKFAKIQRKLEKKAKGKKEKKVKSPKEKKSKKGSDKKSKKSDKKAKGDQKSIKEAKKEEMLRKKLLAEEEAEKMRQLINLKFLFPLQDAIDENFFSVKFPDWGNVLWKKKGREKKEKKKAKSDKDKGNKDDENKKKAKK